MSNVTVLDTKKWTPEQALLSALEDVEKFESEGQEEVECLAVVYRCRNKDDTTLTRYCTCTSNMSAETLHFLGRKLQLRAEE